MDRVVLKKSPLKICLMVLRFSPIEIMGKEYIPMIQDRFRKIGLPYYREQDITDFQLQNEQIPVFKKETQWFFYGVDKQELVIVTKSSLAFQVSSYQHFAAFKARFFELFTLFAQVTDLYASGVCEFLGLRYINAIETRDWQSYLTSSYTGISLPQDMINPEYPVNHSLFVQGVTNLVPDLKGNIVVKLLQNNQGLLVSPDIALIDPPQIQEGKLVTVLDIDHFILLKPGKTNTVLLETLSAQLNQGCEKVFFSAISDRAWKEWI